MATKTWTVEIRIDEHDLKTTAEARLGNHEAGEITAEGSARCNPADQNIPTIGDELATARALSDLAHKLLHKAAEDIESSTHQPVERLNV
ncbi:MAG TPA: DUF1876 domain-containing protein [Pseudonocardiaceae bacterium]